jgi:hypothetical protein
VPREQLNIKNLLNRRLREYLVQTFSVSNNACYPNTISDAVSLLTTFKQGGDASNDNTSKDDAVVSYHEADANVFDDNDVIKTDTIEETTIDADTVVEDNGVELDDSDELNGSDANIDNIDHDNDNCILRVTFNETVMASIIAEATADNDNDHFIGASFTQLQDVSDVYEDDEPDLVVCAHIIDYDDIKDESKKEVSPPIHVNQ